MKARVKATGEIVDIYEQTLLTAFDSNDVRLDEVEFLEEDTNFTPNYWTRLEHQYAGMAMQGILSNYELYREIAKSRNLESVIMEYASDLVKRLKEKEERK